MIACLFYYAYLGENAKNKNKTDVDKSADKASELLVYDFDNKYPKTVRETVKLHNAYLKAIYNGSFSEEELMTANRKLRNLLDEELLEYNSETDQLLNLKNEMQQYKDEKKKLVNYTVAEGDTVEYNKGDDDREYAKIRVTLMIKIEGVALYPEVDYLLRKDTDGNWKVVGWSAVDSLINGTTESK